MKTATLELYEFVESRIKAIEETIEKKGQSLTLEGELIAYNEMKDKIIETSKLDESNIMESFKSGKAIEVMDRENFHPAKKWFNKNFQTIPKP